MAAALSSAGRRRAARAFARTASGAVGDRGGPSTSDSGAALCASELGAQEVARQARATQAAGELARRRARSGELLHRRGLTQPRKRRRHALPTATRLRVPRAANELWCIDFKGWFRTGDGARCDPLTISDGYSRFVLCAQALAHPDYAGCRAQLERVFREYGLPRAIRSDNGAPFASLGAGGLSRLGVWWVKLGITPERIEPGKPEQNGRHERMDRPLKPEPATPPAANLAQQQARFERFRQEFN